MSGEDSFTGLTDSITWPSFLPTLGDDSFLQHLYVQSLDTTFSATDVGLSTQVLVDEAVSFTIPGLDAVAIGIASQGAGTLIPLAVQVYPSFLLQIDSVPVTLNLKTDLFKPVRTVPPDSPGGPPGYEVDPTVNQVSVALGEIGLQIDGDGNISLQAGLSFDIPPIMIGNSGVVIEAHDFGIYLDASSPPPGKRPAGAACTSPAPRCTCPAGFPGRSARWP